MSAHFERILGGLDVAPLLAELEAAPDLWDMVDLRRTAPNSPHREMVDIWLRYRAWDEIAERPASGLEPHDSVWYPAALRLPQCVVMCESIAVSVNADALGGCLITKLPPGGQIYPHIDTGWHRDFYNYKSYIALESNEGCCNWFEDEAFIMDPGEAWRFENGVTHSMKNMGETDRISLIVSMKADG